MAKIEKKGEIYKKRLLSTATSENLKQICRDYKIKGFSSKKKAELVNLVSVSLSEEEFAKVAEENEEKWLSNVIDNAFGLINSSFANTFKTFKIVNEGASEVEMEFEWFKEASSAYIKITNKNIDNPEFDCDCPIGSSGGFCRHFWLGFIFSLKKGYFDLSNWKLITLPASFATRIENIEIFQSKSGGRIFLASKSNSLLQEHVDSEITVREGTIESYEKKSYTYEGNQVEYYLVRLKNADIGKEIIDTIQIRLSSRVFEENALKKGDVINFEGKLVRDQFLGLLVKFINDVSKGKGKKEVQVKREPPSKEKTWRIQSSSDKNKSYIVTLGADGTWKCTCPQFTYRKKICKHISDCKKKI